MVKKLIIPILFLTVACGEDNPVAPTPVTTTAEVVGVALVVEDTPTVHEPAPELVDPVNTQLYSIVGPGGCLDYTEGQEYEWTVTVNEEGYRLRTASFHENDAGCTQTTRKGGGAFEILSESYPGDTVFEWHATRSCGRYQADIAIGDEATESFETIVGVIINTGVDCVDSIVEEVPDEEPDEEVEPEIPEPPSNDSCLGSSFDYGGHEQRTCGPMESNLNDVCRVDNIEDVTPHNNLDIAISALYAECDNCDLFDEFVWYEDSWVVDGNYTAIIIYEYNDSRAVLYPNPESGSTIYTGQAEFVSIQRYVDTDSCASYCDTNPCGPNRGPNTDTICPLNTHNAFGEPFEFTYENQRDGGAEENFLVFCPECEIYDEFVVDEHFWTADADYTAAIVTVGSIEKIYHNVVEGKDLGFIASYGDSPRTIYLYTDTTSCIPAVPTMGQPVGPVGYSGGHFCTYTVKAPTNQPLQGDAFSIQAAVDAASDGSTICVEGSYNSNETQVIIDKSVTIVGTGNITPINAILIIDAPRVEIINFRFRLRGQISSGSPGVGVYVRGNSAGSKILHSIFSSSGAPSINRGIVIETGANVSGLVISDNTFLQSTTGIYTNPHNGIIKIEYNLFWPDNIAGIGGLTGADVRWNEWTNTSRHENGFEAIGIDDNYDGMVRINYNNFLGNSRINLYGSGTQVVNAEDNYWDEFRSRTNSNGAINHITPSSNIDVDPEYDLGGNRR